MKPEISKLLLDNYFFVEQSVRANEKFEASSPMNLTVNDLTVDSQVARVVGDGRRWQVTLKVFHQLNDEVNAPYSFVAELVGTFSVAESYPEDRAEWLVKINASSILYAIARESLRNAMASGPWKPVLLPAVSFYTQEVKDFLKEKRV